jgi:hypothetical protein
MHFILIGGIFHRDWNSDETLGQGLNHLLHSRHFAGAMDSAVNKKGVSQV